MEIKVLSFNIHKGYGCYKQSTFYQIEENIKILCPDFIFFQEILGSQTNNIVLDLCPHFGYGKNVVHAKGHFGNAIFSKYPIMYAENFDLSTHRFERRGLLHCTVQIPNSPCLHLLCVHLGLFRKSREKQYRKIVSHIQDEIPDKDLIILGGDFNDWGSHATLPLIRELGLHEAFMLLHGSYARTFPSWGPLLKLDRIYTRGFNVIRADRLIDKSWRKLSDHLAIKVTLRLIKESND